ncbi:MAG TPA: FAD-binding oxidoreductase, partial [Sphingomicrobium sp.]|nr:FAD-binding oxidoreductase [Sphingomicrobium sp.]
MAEHFHALRVAEIVPETSEANSIRFAVPAELREAFRYRAGQHLTLRAMLGGEEVRRNYSLCTAPADQDWMVTVKRIGGGLFSNWVGDQLKTGDTLDVMPPHGSFTTEFDAGNRRHLVGIAGGSGITPVISLIKTLLGEEPDSRFTLLYGNRDSSSIIFLEALA